MKNRGGKIQPPRFFRRSFFTGAVLFGVMAALVAGAALFAVCTPQ